MSRYATPFLVLNLGSEMIFVVAQRLQAQSVSSDRTNLVLDELIAVLTSKPLITSLMKPQSPYPHKAVKEIIEDIAQSSVMRLDETSMCKLWDLITMVHKWQVTIEKNTISITLRHLYEIENYTTNPNTLLQLHRVQTLVENFNKMLTNDEKIELRHHILHWLRDCNVRVSLLLRLGLQDNEGSFIFDFLSPEAENMMQNIGENIYTKNYKTEANNNNSKSGKEINELDLFVGQILASDTKESGTAKLRLNINSPGLEEMEGFSSIEVKINDKKMEDDLGNVEDLNDNFSFKDDLVAMIGGDLEQ